MTVKVWRPSQLNPMQHLCDGFAEKVKIPDDFIEQYRNSKVEKSNKKEFKNQSIIDSKIPLDDKENKTSAGFITPKKRESSWFLDNTTRRTSLLTVKKSNSSSSSTSVRKPKQSKSILNFFSKIIPNK
jgi:hypothetical protein